MVIFIRGTVNGPGKRVRAEKGKLVTRSGENVTLNNRPGKTPHVKGVGMLVGNETDLGLAQAFFGP